LLLWIAGRRAGNHHMRAFYERLLESGKKPIVAITAAARKLLTIANAKLRDANVQQLS
jgi:transposase